MIGQKGYSLEYRGLSDEEHFRFATKAEPNTLGQYGSKAKDATYIDMSGCYPLTRCYFEFNEDDGLYYRSQHLSGSTDGPHIDALTGKQLTFKNILVQNTFMKSWARDTWHSNATTPREMAGSLRTAGGFT